MLNNENVTLLIKVNENKIDILNNFISVPVGKGGVRSKIVEFSKKSRFRLYSFISDLELPKLMFTLTFPFSNNLDVNEYNIKIKELKRLFDKFLQRNDIQYVYKTEFTRNNVLHYHYLLYFNCNSEIVKLRIWKYLISRIIKIYPEKVNEIKKFQLDRRVFTDIKDKKVYSYFCYYLGVHKKDYQNKNVTEISVRFWGYSKNIYNFKLLNYCFTSDDDDVYNIYKLIVNNTFGFLVPKVVIYKQFNKDIYNTILLELYKNTKIGNLKFFIEN